MGAEAVEYREIPGYPGYRIGTDATVWTRKQRGRWGKMLDEWRPIKVQVNPTTGYLFVAISGAAGRPGKPYVHGLLLEAFIGPRPPGAHGCHNDGDKLNNTLGNLRWDTRSGNMQDAIRHGTFRTGTAHHNAKLTTGEVAEIHRLRWSGLTQRAIAERMGVSQSHVSDILLGRRRRLALKEAFG